MACFLLAGLVFGHTFTVLRFIGVFGLAWAFALGAVYVRRRRASRSAQPPAKPSTKVCPNCAETVKAAANQCR